MELLKKVALIVVLALVVTGLAGCSMVKGWTAPTWVYSNGQARLELLNENAGRNFCLQTKDSRVCGTYDDSDSAVFSSAMAHFNRQPNEVHKPEKESNVLFKTSDGGTWTWVIQTDGSFRDDKNAVWSLAEFRQFGRTYTE